MLLDLICHKVKNLIINDVLGVVSLVEFEAANFDMNEIMRFASGSKQL